MVRVLAGVLVADFHLCPCHLLPLTITFLHVMLVNTDPPINLHIPTHTLYKPMEMWLLFFALKYHCIQHIHSFHSQHLTVFYLSLKEKIHIHCSLNIWNKKNCVCNLNLVCYELQDCLGVIAFEKVR